jgi:type II secretion system protein N
MFKKIGKYIRQPLFLCLVSFICCFCLALLLFLPLEPFTQQLEELARKQGLELHIEAPERTFPLAITAKSIQVSHPSFPDRPMQLEKLEIEPLWSSLTSDNPGITFTLEAYQGLIQGTVMRNGLVDVTINGLTLNETLEPRYPLNLSGRIDTAKFSGMLPLQGNNRSQLQIEMSNINLSGLHNFGSTNDLLPIGQLQSSAQITGQVVKVNRLNISGSDLLLNGNGTLRLGNTPAKSSLNLNLNVTPQASLDPLLKDMLSLVKKPRNDGSYHLRVAGALTNVKLK